MSSLVPSSYHHFSPSSPLFPATNGFAHLATLLPDLPVAPAAPKCRAELHISVRQIEHWLGQTSRLNDTSDLDGALVLDQFPDCAEEGWGELLPR